MTSLRQDRRVWIGGGALLAVVVLALGWVVLVGPQLSSASDLDQQAQSAETQNMVLQNKVRKLEAASKDMDGLNKELQDARAALPITSGMPDFTRQVEDQARSAGVVVFSIVAGAPTLAGAGAAPATSNAPVTAAGNLFSVPVTLVADGALPNHRAFVAAIEGGPRAALIDSVGFGPGEGATTTGTSVDSATRMTVKLQVFVAPQTPTDQAELQKLGG
ncbi:hypothetical protein [Rhodococcus sp. X156]|uniref:hypothetical protein n=1 Tax=Rhodococcus sp. X156 TaxID=2499145 RepID=UPI000FD75A14|nr:hypothetical protein [Rhodococcus sp. X156]